MEPRTVLNQIACATGTVLLTHFTRAANRARDDIAKRQADVV